MAIVGLLEESSARLAHSSSRILSRVRGECRAAERPVQSCRQASGREHEPLLGDTLRHPSISVVENGRTLGRRKTIYGWPQREAFGGPLSGRIVRASGGHGLERSFELLREPL